MKVKIKRLNDLAVIPQYAKQGDAGMDLTATSKRYDEDGNVVYGTGLVFEIPEGYVGLLFPRSSNSKQDLLLSNSVGVLDSGYRGEVTFKFKVLNHIDAYGCEDIYDFKLNIKKGLTPPYTYTYNIGDRIGQLVIMPYPKIEFEEVQELSDSERGTGGYGSTGK